MQRSQAQTGNLFLLAQWVANLKPAQLFGLLFGLREAQSSAEHDIAARYDGCAWSDSTEHRLTNEIMTGVRTHFV